MKPNIRVLAFVAALAVVMAAGIVLVRPSSTRFSERIAPRAEGSAERQTAGFLLQFRGDAFLLTLPSCDMSAYSDRFFVHVYPATSSGGVAQEFINLDFDLTKEPVRRVAMATGEQCIAERPLATAKPKEVVIGQFTMPDGRCCEIIWSRTFVIGR